MNYQVTVFFNVSDAAGRTSTRFTTDDQYKVRDALWSSQSMDFVPFLDTDNQRMIIVDRSNIQHIEIIPSEGKSS